MNACTEAFYIDFQKKKVIKETRKMFKKLKEKKGFTLVELIVVLVILAILAALVAKRIIPCSTVDPGTDRIH